MRIKTAVLTGIASVMLATSVTADGHGAPDAPRVYAFAGTENYCPAGLQPVSMDGAVCCGVPNQGMSYQQAMAHPVRKKHVRRVARVDCPIGQKGCNY